MAKITTIRFEDDFHEELSVAMIRRKVPSLKDLVTQLLKDWLNATQKRGWPIEERDETIRGGTIASVLAKMREGADAIITAGSLTQVIVAKSGTEVKGAAMSLPDLVRDIHQRWRDDPASVNEAWARHFEEIESAAGVIAFKNRNPPGIQDVSDTSDLTVPCELPESGASNSASVILVDANAAAGWHQVLQRIFCFRT
jgi:hypothetical protein